MDCFSIRSLIDSLLKCVRKQHVVLKSSGMNTNETNEDYENILTIVADNREVAWADQSIAVAEKEAEPLDLITNAEKKLKNSLGIYANKYLSNSTRRIILGSMQSEKKF